MLLSLPVVALGADDVKISQLEQDIRDLQRQVQALSRQLDSQRLPPSAVAEPIRPRAVPAPSTGMPQWVDAAKWKRLATGMSELEVFGVLGPPTTMRTEQGQRLLLYALEIGNSGFLRGSVTLQDRTVVAIQAPVLQ
jgi:hypothetical protein